MTSIKYGRVDAGGICSSSFCDVDMDDDVDVLDIDGLDDRRYVGCGRCCCNHATASIPLLTVST